MRRVIAPMQGAPLGLLRTATFAHLPIAGVELEVAPPTRLGRGDAKRTRTTDHTDDED